MRQSIIITLAAAILTATTGCQQSERLTKRDIGPQVHSRFVQLYPMALRVKWYKAAKRALEARYINDDKKGVAFFREDGVWIETYTQTDTSKVPVPVLASLMQKYPSYKIKGVSHVFNSVGAENYNFAISEPELKVNRVVEFNSEGVFLREELSRLRFRSSVIKLE